MKIKYFGTAAAEGFPGIFCGCDTCRRAFLAGGRNIRTRSQALVDGKILIDFPPDTYMHVLFYGLDLKPIKTCLITHGHSDHIYPNDLAMRKFGYAYINEAGDVPPLNIYASGASSRVITGCGDISIKNRATVRVSVIDAFEPFYAEGYEVTALKAAHEDRLQCLIYMISDGVKTMLYANDTGYFKDETWAYLEKTRPRFDYVSLDCTGITMRNNMENHMSLDTNIKVRDRLVETGCADGDTIFCTNHFSHNGGLTHDEFVPVAAEKGFIVSYDTMEVEF